MNFIKYFSNNIKFIFISICSGIIILISAVYVSNLFFAGKNSYEVYSKLKRQKVQLLEDIEKLQYENATLQKQYLELKNLEPEEL